MRLVEPREAGRFVLEKKDTFSPGKRNDLSDRMGGKKKKKNTKIVILQRKAEG